MELCIVASFILEIELCTVASFVLEIELLDFGVFYLRDRAPGLWLLLS
jgi:hypothetical protein